MQRRNFLVGIGSVSIGGSALLGTGAFSRVESQRDVTIAVAEDPDAYLGLSGTGSLNSDNYVELDEKGHVEIDVGESGNGGSGVNSDSFTWFDSMVRVCNQGKEAVGFYIEEPTDDDFPGGVDATGPEGTPYEEEPRLQFYTGEAANGWGDDGTTSVMGEDNAVDIPVGACVDLGVRTLTKGVDATSDDPLFGGEVRLIAEVTLDTALGRQEDPVRNTQTREGYSTIQEAVDDADEGDSIEVLTGGVFDEEVTIGTDGVSLGPNVVNRPEITGGIRVEADGVTVRGLKITGTVGSSGAPIDLQANDVTIQDNVVEGGEPGGGIMPWAGPGPVNGNVEISGNEVRGGAIGLYVDDEADITIADNETTDPGDEGIWLSDAFGGTLENATVVLQGNSVSGAGAADIKIEDEPQELNGETDLGDLDVVAENVLNDQKDAQSIELWDQDVYPFPNNPFLRGAQTDNGGLFANLGGGEVVPLEEGTKMSEFPTADGSGFGLDGHFMQPVYANTTDEEISIEVESIGFGPTSLALGVDPYDESEFGAQNPWTRIPTGSGTPYPIVGSETAWDEDGNFEGEPISGGPDGDYELVEISETADGFKVVWEFLGVSMSSLQSMTTAEQHPDDDATAIV